MLERGEDLGSRRAFWVFGVWVFLLLVAVFGVVLNVPLVGGSGTIYIQANGRIYPSTAPISSVDNVIYTFTDNIYDEIVVERSNIVVDGASYTVQGTGAYLSKGIDLSYISNVTVKNTTIRNFYHGIYLDYASEVTLIGNNITANNWDGIELVDSSNNSIVGNNITNNWYGIWLSYSSNNSIYHNNFIDNAQQVYNETPDYPNYWDNGYPSGGNYWSNYVGEDLYLGPYQNLTGSDGIGDTPYIISENNLDNYPLMNPYEYWSNPIPGDINKDTKVENRDLALLATAYGSTPEKPNWNPNCDINGDNKVDVFDLFILSKNYGKTYP